MSRTFDAWRARSPFYGATHAELSDVLRRFFAREATPNVEAWEAAGEMPREFHRKAGEAGILGIGFPARYGGSGEDTDFFHKLVQVEEMAGPGAGGVMAGLLSQHLALPPLLAFGSQALIDRVVPPVLSGERIVALGVTEPSGGSDVARLRTRAERRGDRYMVNGSKTFITNGMRADFIVTAVRTGGEGLGGISLLLLEPGMPGFARTRLAKMGWHSSDTATLYFDNVEVPATNLIGPENGGFAAVMDLFNGERLIAAQQCTAFARVCLEEAADWAATRETFGRKLGQHQVIRSKLADVARHIAATQAWVDLCAWQFQNDCATPADLALVKVQGTRMLEFVAREAAQVLGGASYLTGSKVERIYREVRVLAIGGGSEEILLDLAGRQMKFG
jgi:acyl-CoA dehydrogenase